MSADRRKVFFFFYETGVKIKRAPNWGTYVPTDINIWPCSSLTVDTDLVKQHLKFIYFYYEMYDKSVERHVNRMISGNGRQRPHPQKKKKNYQQRLCPLDNWYTMYQNEISTDMEYKII